MDNNSYTVYTRNIRPIQTSKKIKIEDIIILIAIAIIVGIAIWKLVGSPTDTAALISITLFVAASELALWKKVYFVEKKTELGFIKVRGDISLLRNDLKHYLKSTSQRLDNIEKLIKKTK